MTDKPSLATLTTQEDEGDEWIAKEPLPKWLLALLPVPRPVYRLSWDGEAQRVQYSSPAGLPLATFEDLQEAFAFLRSCPGYGEHHDSQARFLVHLDKSLVGSPVEDTLPGDLGFGSSTLAWAFVNLHDDLHWRRLHDAWQGWLRALALYEEAPGDWLRAHEFISHHPALWRRRPGQPLTGPEGKPALTWQWETTGEWVSFSVYEEQPGVPGVTAEVALRDEWGRQGVHDLRLDACGATYEDALLRLAWALHRCYSPQGLEREDAPSLDEVQEKEGGRPWLLALPPQEA